MKTDKEILDFYGVEMGKTYIVTKIHSDLVEQYKNQQFKIYKDKDELYFDGFLVAFKSNDGYTSTRRLSCLRYLDYEEIKPEILDKEEKEYLTNIIKPFKNKVKVIYKGRGADLKEFICIRIENDTPIMLPDFNEGSMYKDMEYNKEYTLADLGL